MLQHDWQVCFVVLWKYLWSFSSPPGKGKLLYNHACLLQSHETWSQSTSPSLTCTKQLGQQGQGWVTAFLQNWWILELEMKLFARDFYLSASKLWFGHMRRNSSFCWLKRQRHISGGCKHWRGCLPCKPAEGRGFSKLATEFLLGSFR